MGIALAIGALFGVRAAAGNALVSALVLAMGICILTILLPREARSIGMSAALGCAIGLFCGLWREQPPSPPLPSSLPAPLVATVVSDPSIFSHGAFARIRWNDGDTFRTTAVFLPAAPRVQRGDTIAFTLADADPPLVEPLAIDTLVLVSPAGGADAARNRVRHWLREQLDHHVPGAPGALALGLIVGDDSALTRQQRDNLRAAGLAHITAVSGWNVTLVVTAVAALLGMLGLVGFGWTSVQVAAVGLFVWVVGPDPPVVRAAIMCLAVFAARWLGRPAHSITLLTLTAAAMVCVSPGLLGSASFRLTIAATLALLYATAIRPDTEGWKRGVQIAILTPVFAAVATMPILAAQFGTLSLATIPANIAVAPVVPVAALSSILCIVVTPVPILATTVGALSWYVNDGILRTADFFADIPHLHWEFEPLPADIQAGVLTALVLCGGAFTAEGKAIRRHVGRWSATRPRLAGLGMGTAALVLIAVLLVM